MRRHRGEQCRLPHLGILRGGEAVEEPGVHQAVEQRKAFAAVTQVQIENDPGRQHQSMHPGDRRRPLANQRRRLVGQIRLACQGPSQILGAHGIALGGDDVQPRPGGRQRLEAVPGAQHVEPGAEARFTDHEGALLVPGGKALGQPVGGDKHVLGLGATVVAREVHIVEGTGVRADSAVVLSPVQFGGSGGGQGGEAIWR